VLSLILIFSCWLPIVLCGCGGATIKGANTASASGTLEATPGNVSFGAVSLGQTASSNVAIVNEGSVAVQITTVSVAGQSFSLNGTDNLPMTLAAGGTYSFSVSFSPTAAGASTGQLAITSNASNGGTTVVGLNGMGTATSTPTLSSLSCASGSLIGPATDSCTVTLSGAAPAAGITASLASNNASVTVPGTVMVAARATSAAFNATVSSVSSSQTVTLTANSGGISETFALQLAAGPGSQPTITPALSVSTSSLSFGNVAVNTTASQTITLSSTGTEAVTVNGAGVSGSGFTVSAAGLPLTLAPNQTATLSLQFDPTVAGASTGQLTIASNSSTGSSTVVNLSGTGTAASPAAAAVSALSCANLSVMGAGTDSCTITLNAAAPSGGLSVSLTSSSGAVAVPAGVIVPAGAISVSFTAYFSSVSTFQTATLVATGGGVSANCTLQLNAGAAGLGINATNVAFGNVPVNTAVTQSVTLTASGALPITIGLATVTGTGFSLSGASFPLILTQGQTATLDVVFDPVTAGAATGQLIMLGTSLPNGEAVVNLSGTGALLQVSLTWQPPGSSADPVAGYNIYRSADGGASYQLLNPSVLTLTNYFDANVLSGRTYNYVVESVDAAGNQSAPSNSATVSIP
jgi:hypothetical protein